MNKNLKIPPIIQAGAWLLSLIVFAVGFWHTHLGLKEMRPFNSEWGGLAIAGIVLLLLLITYWFAVNGKKMALVFYIMCGIVFFVCNLNYFYPSYMARTLIKEEASALKDTIDHYHGKATRFSNEKLSLYQKVTAAADQVIFQIKSNHGFGEKARSALQDFNSLAGEKIPPPNDVVLNEQQIADWENQMAEAVARWLLANAGEGVLKALEYSRGLAIFDSLQQYTNPVLKEIAIDDTQIAMDSIKTNPNVLIIKSTVERINSGVISINEGKGYLALESLPKELYPNASRLGEIQNTFQTIGRRLSQISTWAIILLCLFIDLIVPLAIYLLLRKRLDAPVDKSLTGKLKPTTF